MELCPIYPFNQYIANTWRLKEKRTKKLFALKSLFYMVGRARFELATNGLKVRKTLNLLVLIDVDKLLLYQ